MQHLSAAVTWATSRPETQTLQSSLGCLMGIWTLLVEYNVITHRSRGSSAFQIIRSSLWEKRELLEETRMKGQRDVRLGILVEFVKDLVICRQH